MNSDIPNGLIFLAKAMAGRIDLAMGPIAELGTPEQKKKYMTLCCPGNPSGKTWRGSFALTEPLPYVGVDTGVLCGRVSVAEWKDGEVLLLQ